MPLKIFLRGLGRLSRHVGMYREMRNLWERLFLVGAAGLSARYQCAHRQLHSAARSCDDFKARWSSVVFHQADAWPCPIGKVSSKLQMGFEDENCFGKEGVDNCQI